MVALTHVKIQVHFNPIQVTMAFEATAETRYDCGAVFLFSLSTASSSLPHSLVGSDYNSISELLMVLTKPVGSW